MTRDLDFKGLDAREIRQNLVAAGHSAAKAHQGDDKGTNAESEQPRVQSRISTKD